MVSILACTWSSARRTFDFSRYLSIRTAGELTYEGLIVVRLKINTTLFHIQLIRDIGITHGNESQVGYYVGIMVCNIVELGRFIS